MCRQTSSWDLAWSMNFQRAHDALHCPKSVIYRLIHVSFQPPLNKVNRVEILTVSLHAGMASGDLVFGRGNLFRLDMLNALQCLLEYQLMPYLVVRYEVLI